MGKHSNIILVSARGVILEAIKRISHKVNRVREVLPGLPYTTPPTQAGRLDPFDHATVSAIQSAMAQAPASTVKERADWLTGRVAGLSPFLSVHIATAVTHEPKEQPSRLPEVWGSIFGSIEQERFQPVQIHAGTTIVAAYPFQVAQIPQAAQQQVEDLNRALDAVYSSAVQSTTAAAKISQLLGETERDRKRVRRQLEIAERTLHEAGRAEQHKQAGELILANLWRIEAGANKVTVQDYFDPNLGDRELSLDPKLSAQENADALFRRYRKVRDGQATAGTRAAEARDQLVLLDAAANRLAELDASDVSVGAAVERLRLEMREQGLLQHRPQEAGEERAAGPDLQGHKIRRQTTPEGYEIYIGETATANDYLTTRLAAPNDLWLHVRASTSAHVVIKTNGKPDLVPKSVIEYAALVCARHSSQKHSGLVPVDYTLKKHVRKPRGAAPGSADYHHETTIHVEP
jgi:predicted ribosome quality control (RQC) complex YloA/Tae2 family protein